MGDTDIMAPAWSALSLCLQRLSIRSDSEVVRPEDLAPMLERARCALIDETANVPFAEARLLLSACDYWVVQSDASRAAHAYQFFVKAAFGVYRRALTDEVRAGQVAAQAPDDTDTAYWIE